MSDAAEQAGPVLSVSDARVSFGKLTAVRDVTFSLGGGQLLGLVGPNGADKTTLLRAIVGLQPLTGGEVRVMGQLVEPGNTDAFRHLGFTPDTPPLYDQLTVGQYLRMIAMGYDLTPSEAGERIDFWLERLWLAEKKDQKIKALSRGMRQRVGIARTLLPNPSVILLDEPAAGIDPAGRVQFRQLLVALREQGKALIVSSHILTDMADYCSHIAIMSEGTIQRMGTVAQISAAVTHHERCRYTIVLAHPVARVGDLLQKIDGVEQIDADTDRVSLEFASSRDDAARLLREIIRMDLPVASFSANTPDLEEAYLRAGVKQVD